MIIVSFDRSEDGSSLVLTVNGHAGTGEMGHDLVCSAATILTATFAEYARFMEHEDQLRKRPHITIESGRAEVVVKPKKEYYSEALHAMFTVQMGFALLTANYPDNVEVHMLGRDIADISDDITDTDSPA